MTVATKSRLGVRCANSKLARGRIGEELDFTHSRREIVENFNSPLEQRLAVDGRLDPVELRSSRRTPRALSRLAMVRETTGWEIASCFAALAILPVSAHREKHVELLQFEPAAGVCLIGVIVGYTQKT